MKKGRRIGALLLALFVAVSGSGCRKNTKPERQDGSLKRYDVQYLDLFDTVTSVVGYAESEEAFSAYTREFYEEMREYHRLYDIYEDYDGLNNLKTINDNAGIRPVKVDARIIGMLREAKEMYELTSGRMNVAMGSVLSIWHEYRTEGINSPGTAKLPPMEALEEAAKHTDIDKVEIDEEASTVYLSDRDMSLDVGSVAKGYATEMACRSLEQKGVTHALVSVGGNVRAIGDRADKSLWQVGIQNPDLGSTNPYLHRAGIKDMSLVTSGTYQRYYTVDGKNYHHIIHPDLLMPWDRYASVSIICKDSGMADCLSTAVFNMEPEEGERFIEGLKDVEAMWVYPDGREVYSSGFEAFITDGGN